MAKLLDVWLKDTACLAHSKKLANIFWDFKSKLNTFKQILTPKLNVPCLHLCVFIITYYSEHFK